MAIRDQTARLLPASSSRPSFPLGEKTRETRLSGQYLLQRLNELVDVASLAVFRMLFGAVMAFAMVRFLANGWVEELYVRPTFFFSYDYFPWVKPLPAAAMHALFVTLAVLALCVAVGF